MLLTISALSPTSTEAAHADLSYVPLDHWSYQVFYRLASLGLVPLDAVSARPITRGVARRLVAEALAREGNAPFYYWTYNLGAGWQFQDVSRLEAGYRGAAAVWRDQTPDMTILYWDGFYLQQSFQS